MLVLCLVVLGIISYLIETLAHWILLMIIFRLLLSVPVISILMTLLSLLNFCLPNIYGCWIIGNPVVPNDLSARFLCEIAAEIASPSTELYI